MSAYMDSQEQIDRPIGTLIAAVTLAVSTLALAGRMPATMQSFREMFASFGAELPGVTLFALAHPYAWWMLAVPAAALMVWIVSRSRVSRGELSRMRRSLVALLVITLLSYAAVAWAIYRPIFGMAKVV